MRIEHRLLALLVAFTAIAACSGDDASSDPAPVDTRVSDATAPGDSDQGDSDQGGDDDGPVATSGDGGADTNGRSGDPGSAGIENRLRMEDNQLVDADGEPVVLLGSTLYAFPFYLSDGWVDWPVMVESRRNVEHLDQILDRMAEFGFDTIRVPLGTDAWAEHIYALTTEEWLDRIERIVADAAERDIHVMFTWWDALTWGSEWPQRYDESFEFMRAVHERVGDEPNVMIEPMNEPREITWDEWIEATSATVRFWREDLGYDGVLILDTINWSWSFDPDAADELIDLDTDLLGEPNLMFAIHRYANDRTCFCDDELEQWERSVGRHIGDYPIIVTEVGNVNEGFPAQPQWVDQFVDHLVTDGVDRGLNGVLAFTWRWQDENSMTEWDGVNLTAFGSRIIDLMLSGSEAS
jgi:hypothetical protein